jgi:hypothetical protein
LVRSLLSTRRPDRGSAAALGFMMLLPGPAVRNIIVGKIDSVGAALLGGLIAGAIAGAAQWLALRSFVPWAWIVATSVGMAAGLTAGAALVHYGISRGDLMLMGAVTGLAVGGLQGVPARPTRLGCALVDARESAGLGTGLVRDHVS